MKHLIAVESVLKKHLAEVKEEVVAIESLLSQIRKPGAKDGYRHKPRTRHTRYTVTCDLCGKAFKYKTDPGRTRHHFCRKPCTHGKWLRQEMKKRQQYKEAKKGTTGEPFLNGWYTIQNTFTGEWLATMGRTGMSATRYTFSVEQKDALWFRTRAQVLIVIGKLRRRSKKPGGPRGPFVIVKDDSRVTKQAEAKRAKKLQAGAGRGCRAGTGLPEVREGVHPPEE
jgi:hypothetical protein